jgi:hypothetical protein
MIHMQGNDGRPSCWGEAEQIAAILALAEVLTPALSTRMEEKFVLACQRVSGLHLCSLKFVTGMAGHTMVLPHCLATGCFRDNMVDHRMCSHDGSQGRQYAH